jgi:hypothetical protein
MSNQQQNGNKPVYTIRHGRIKATIWANQTQRGTMYNVTVVRSYQDEQNNWHDSQSFGVLDLMTLAKAAFDAHTWISTQKASSDGSAERNEGRGKKSPSRQSAAA